jgi:endonuclease G, mitochondrial
MKKILTSILLLLAFLAKGQLISNKGDTALIKHTFYTSVFVKSQHIPALVEYTLSSSMLICENHLDRGRFSKDPFLPAETDLNNEYKGKGYDRGHLMNAKDNDCSPTGMKECFYFSNMFPQTHQLNAGPWLRLEEEERRLAAAYDSIKVYIGSLGEKEKIGNHLDIRVPDSCWKVIYIPSIDKQSCYVFANTKESRGGFQKGEIDCRILGSLAHMKFMKAHVYIDNTNIAEYKNPHP